MRNACLIGLGIGGGGSACTVGSLSSGFVYVLPPLDILAFAEAERAESATTGWLSVMYLGIRIRGLVLLLAARRGDVSRTIAVEPGVGGPDSPVGVADTV